MDYKLLAVPAIVLVALGAALFLNQPKVVDAGKQDYVNVNGDEYLKGEYVLPDNNGIGDIETSAKIDTSYPKTIESCSIKEGDEKEFCYLQYAKYNSDPKGCEAIKGQSARDDCFAGVAEDTNNSGLCGKVKYGYSECFVQLAMQTNNAGLCENGRIQKQKCLEAVAAKKFELCFEDFERGICNDAVNENDPSLCESIPDYSGFCYYQVAASTNNASLCSKAGDSSSTCIFRIATSTNNKALCESLADSRDNCIAWIAFNTKDRELCYQAGSEAQSCLEDIAYAE